MTKIGSLPNLQVLEIFHNHAEVVSEWMPIEGQFLRLKCLGSTFDHLVRWEVEKEQFPSLESLILKGARSMYEIPYGIGEIDTLQLIQLHDCGESLVDSAKRIREQQHDNGNDAFQVRIL
ncbi:putative late blight resistance protein homolog R1A-3 [Henckelia pumila]|uniref:putative late blight resistance protein homolog R1A-3 n=1 Tax=Henckelia pumila TaxID=405737 RepID=UPI003C6E9C16